LPHSQAVFALYGADERAEPYIGRTPNLRARLERLLQPSANHPRRLHLAGLVRRIEWQLTGSEFESLLVQFDLLQNEYGTKCLDRMHLRAPAFVRFLGSNPYPRIAVTHRPSLRESDWAYGPFLSRAAAERFSDEMLKLFLLRRCTDDLTPHPGHPGCVYSEMKMCLAPCYKGCTDEQYAQESAAVENFLATRGESRLVTLRAQRDEASAELAFESAATLHAQVERVEQVRALAAEIVRPLSQLRAVVLQASPNPDEVAVFLFESGRLRGPAAFSTLGMRIQNEQSGSTSLFAQPMAIEPVPEVASASGPAHQRDQSGSDSAAETPAPEGPAKIAQGEAERNPGEGRITNPPPRRAGANHEDCSSPEHDAEAFSGPDPNLAEPVPNNDAAFTPVSPIAPAKIPRSLLESRLESALAELSAPAAPPSAAIRQGHLALLKRWYYRPESRRAGEIFFPDAENRWPTKAILRGIGRVAARALESVADK
jgi:hypothetical protein